MKSNNSTTTEIWRQYYCEKKFDDIDQKRILEIIKYNKRLQKIFNKNIDDYKKEYWKIEIEIIPIENKVDKIINNINIKKIKIDKNILILQIKILIKDEKNLWMDYLKNINI